MAEHSLRKELGLLNEHRRTRRCDRVIRDRTNPLDYLSHQDLVSKFRLCRNAILFLVDILEPALASSTHHSHAVSVNLQVLSVLYYLASGSFQCVMGESHDINLSVFH